MTFSAATRFVVPVPDLLQANSLASAGDFSTYQPFVSNVIYENPIGCLTWRSRKSHPITCSKDIRHLP
jgi:hypothetical protein